jgi:hypothetical protein
LEKNVNNLLITVAEAALKLGIKPKTLRNWMSNKENPPPVVRLVVRLGKKPMFRPTDLSFFVDGLVPTAAQKVTPLQITPPPPPAPARRGPRTKAERIRGQSGVQK